VCRRRAIVTAVDAAHAMVKIHFLGWGKRYDEWIHTGTPLWRCWNQVQAADIDVC